MHKNHSRRCWPPSRSPRSLSRPPRRPSLTRLARSPSSIRWKEFRHPPGQRRKPHQGVCAAGTFTATPDAHLLTRSPVFAGKPVPVVARFSIAGGRPNIPDTAATRAAWFSFSLPDGSEHMMAMLHTPVFGVATPAAFLENLQAASPIPRRETGSGKAEGIHRRAPRNEGAGRLPESQQPAGELCQHPHYSLHAFRFENRAKQARYLRWQFVPQDGTRFLDDAALSGTPPDFLEAALKSRIAQGPIRWDMWW